MSHNSRKRNPGLLAKSVLGAFVAVWLVFFLSPIFWMFLTSLKPTSIAFSPKVFFMPTLDNYINAFFGELDFAYYFTNSFVITTVSIAVATFLAAMAAFGFARYDFKGKSTALLGLLVFYMIPHISYAIPLFVLMQKLSLLDTRLGLIIVFTALTVPFATWVLHGYLITIPKELEESAMVDGCSRFKALFRVILPLAAPGLAATSILTFITTWNVFLFPAILAGNNSKTLPVAISMFITDKGIRWGEASAVASVIILPVLVLTALAQRHIVMGLTGGAVKS